MRHGRGEGDERESAGKIARIEGHLWVVQKSDSVKTS